MCVSHIPHPTSTVTTPGNFVSSLLHLNPSCKYLRWAEHKRNIEFLVGSKFQNVKRVSPLIDHNFVWIPHSFVIAFVKSRHYYSTNFLFRICALKQYINSYIFIAHGKALEKNLLWRNNAIYPMRVTALVTRYKWKWWCRIAHHSPTCRLMLMPTSKFTLILFWLN